jgi:hypothetical protein
MPDQLHKCCAQTALITPQLIILAPRPVEKPLQSCPALLLNCIVSGNTAVSLERVRSPCITPVHSDTMTYEEFNWEKAPQQVKPEPKSEHWGRRKWNGV